MYCYSENETYIHALWEYGNDRQNPLSVGHMRAMNQYGSLALASASASASASARRKLALYSFRPQSGRASHASAMTPSGVTIFFLFGGLLSLVVARALCSRPFRGRLHNARRR
jgi:hypothetical protein